MEARRFYFLGTNQLIRIFEAGLGQNFRARKVNKVRHAKPDLLEARSFEFENCQGSGGEALHYLGLWSTARRPSAREAERQFFDPWIMGN